MVEMMDESFASRMERSPLKMDVSVRHWKSDGDLRMDASEMAVTVSVVSTKRFRARDDIGRERR